MSSDTATRTAPSPARRAAPGPEPVPEGVTAGATAPRAVRGGGHGHRSSSRRRGPARLSTPRDGGRLLRVLTGVDEELLAEVRHERSKFTSLGGVVLGTAVVAAFSMWNFATEALGRVSLFAALPTVIWFLFILNLDRWLVTPVPNARRRIAPVVLRLTVALMLGMVVAEPLVLRIFATAVEEHIAEGRADGLDVLRGRLEVCTTETAGAGGALPAKCPGRQYVVAFGITSAAQAGQLRTLRADAAALQKSVNHDNHDLAALDSQVRDECRQLIRDAATGLLERTSECQRLRARARDFRATHAIGAEESRLAGLNKRISALDNDVTASRTSYERSRATAIDARLAKERERQKSPGVLERMQALDDLATGKPVLFCGIWLVRALFVFLDILPVLAKSLGGENTYDRMLTCESNCAVRMHAERVRRTELRAVADTEMAQHAIDQEIERSRAELEAARREVVSRTNIRTRQAINALEEELRRTSAR